LATIPSLSDEEWGELLERLTLYAAYKMIRLYWRGVRGSRGGKTPGGLEPQDLAAEAVLSVIDGTRTWNHDVAPDLLGFLRGVVDSKISHLVESLENRVTRRANPSGCGSANPGTIETGIDPVEVSADAEYQERFRRLVTKAISGDKLVFKVFECLQAEITKPADMAVVLDVEVQQINNAQKRLRRKVAGVLKKLGKSGTR
jgi:hypothetical protein